MKNTEQKIPALRFPEFSGEWEEKRLGEIAEIKRGVGSTNIDYSDNGIRLIRINDFYENNPVFIKPFKDMDRFKVLNRDILFAGTGATAGISYLPPKDWFGLLHSYNAPRIRIDERFNLKYVYQYLQSDKITRQTNSMFVGAAQHFLDTAAIASLLIFFSGDKSEQQKIADFLSAVDKRLQLLKDKKAKLEEYKRGVMQRIFSQELRFTRPDGSAYPNWEEKRLGEIAERITQRNTELNENVLTISAQEGLINQLKYFNNSVAAKNISGYYLLHRDDFAYNKSYSKGYPMGAIKRLNNYPKGIVSTLYICFRNKKEFANSFAEQYFESGIHNRELEKVAQEGARNHGLLNIGVGDFFDTIVLLPCLDEQRQIADFLSAIDDKISLLNQQITSTEQYKKGLLQQMFV